MTPRELIEKWEREASHLETDGVDEMDEKEASIHRQHAAELRAALPEQPNSKVICHAPGDRCPGCPHYWGKADECSYTRPEQPLAENDDLVNRVAEVIFRTEDKPPGPPEGPLSMYKGPLVKKYYDRAREVLKELEQETRK